MICRGVTFINTENEEERYHTYDDFGLILESAPTPPPMPKRETISIPGRDGVIDLTGKLTGEVKYENRELTFNVVDLEDRRHYSVIFSRLAGCLNGKTFKIILDKDKSYFYRGFVYIEDYSERGKTDASDIVIKCDVEPYKYSIESTSERWKWDPFSFIDGVIMQLSGLEVNGSLTVTVEAGDRFVSPSFTCSSDMTVEVNGQSYSLKSGTSTNRELRLHGRCELTFKGNGTVTIDLYRGVF